MKFFFLSLTILLAISLHSCKNNLEEQTKNYQLVVEDGIFVEKFDSIITDDNKYNENNIVFKVGTEFKYAYQYISPENETYLFKLTNSDWEFVKPTESDSLTVKHITIKALNRNPMGQRMPDYNQTNLSYKLDKKASFSMSGVIENENNIWMHPPRQNLFRILELNPFPYIKAPYEVGTQWNWQLKIGSNWGDERWKTWEGVIENLYDYKITAKEKLQTKLGILDCFKIESTATSEIGETSLTSYFHEKYGFVKLNYINIDGSKTILELVAHNTGIIQTK